MAKKAKSEEEAKKAQSMSLIGKGKPLVWQNAEFLSMTFTAGIWERAQFRNSL